MNSKSDYLKFNIPSESNRENRFLNIESMIKLVYILVANVMIKIKFELRSLVNTCKIELLDDMRILLGKVYYHIEGNSDDEYENIPRDINRHFRNIDYFMKVLGIEDDNLLNAIMEIRFKLVAFYNYKRPNRDHDIRKNLHGIFLSLSDTLNESVEYFRKKKYYDYCIRKPLTDKEAVEEHNKYEDLIDKCELTQNNIRGLRDDLEEEEEKEEEIIIEPTPKRGWFFGLFSCCGL